MVILDPTCTHCVGTGHDGGGPCPLCKGRGRAPLPEPAPIEEWVRWMREQSNVKESLDVLARLLALHEPPIGLTELVEAKRDA